MKYLKPIVRSTAVILLMMLLFTQGTMAAAFDYVQYKGRHLPIPRTYEVKQVIYDLGEGYGFLNQAEDLFIDKKGFLYAADTANNRIVKMTREGKGLAIYSGPANKPLKGPTGVFVDDDGDLFVADTGNGRVVHLSPDGSFIEEFGRPQSDLLGADFTYTPSKITVSPSGYMYVVKSNTIMSIDANNSFRGNIGAVPVGFDFNRMIIRMFASEEQKKRLVKPTPAFYSNIAMDDKGLIYATAINTGRGQIRVINSVGKNTYPDKLFYGEYGANGKDLPYFADIAVDKNGVITVLEQKTGRIYQYDVYGNNLTTFGGKGKWKGVFDFPSSLAVDADGKVYVLDRKLNNIQVFEPTRFIELVNQATGLYSEGRYAETKQLWQEVLKIDANYSLAHAGIGKVLMKEGKWYEAMQEYLSIDDKSGYSSAFAEYRHEILRNYFGLVVFIGIFLIIALSWIIKRLRKYAKKVWEEGI